MMRSRPFYLPALLVVVLAGSLCAQDVGSFVPSAEWTDMSQTSAKSYDDFVGRLKVIEVFAHW